MNWTFKTKPKIDGDLFVTEGQADKVKSPRNSKASAGLTVVRTGGSTDSAELSDAQSVVGEDMTITGTMTSKGEIQIDGQVHGDVTCSSVTIGESGTLQGNVLADQVNVCGRVDGTIYGTKVILRAKSSIVDDIHHCLLSIEEGAQFEGLSRRWEDPKTLVQAAREARRSGVTTQSHTASIAPGGKRPAA